MPAPAHEAGERSQPLVRIKVESPQFRSVHWYECVVYEDGRLPILLARYIDEIGTYKLSNKILCTGTLGGELQR